jgi:hypothetical protein
VTSLPSPSRHLASFRDSSYAVEGKLYGLPGRQRPSLSSSIIPVLTQLMPPGELLLSEMQVSHHLRVAHKSAIKDLYLHPEIRRFSILIDDKLSTLPVIENVVFSLENFRLPSRSGVTRHQYA